MLEKADIESLKNGTWELDCPIMIARGTKHGVEAIYEGGGYIRRASNGNLYFKLYSSQEIGATAAKDFFSSSGRTPGKLISNDEYYDLTATDTRGRKWQSKYMLPDTSNCFGEKGVVVSGKLHELTHVSDKNFPGTRTSSYLDVKFFQNFKIPFNSGIQTVTHFAGQPRMQSASRNLAKFKSCDCEFEMWADSGVINLRASSNSDKLLACLEIRAIEALQFVLAFPVEWALLQKCEGNVETIIIKATDVAQPQTKLQPPIGFTDLCNADCVWKLYDKYLSYIMANTDATKFHPVSVFAREIMSASEGSLEARALTLGIAIEGILRVEFSNFLKLASDEIEKLNNSLKVIDECTLDNEFKKRIKGAMASWDLRSATDVLFLLVRKGVVEEYEFNAWKKLRHPFAHGSVPNFRDLQVFIDLVDRAQVLFYKLVFHTIRYEGKYTDYGAVGWPSKVYSIVATNSQDANKE
jgi:hypothetical protein